MQYGTVYATAKIIRRLNFVTFSRKNDIYVIPNECENFFNISDSFGMTN